MMQECMKMVTGPTRKLRVEKTLPTSGKNECQAALLDKPAVAPDKIHV
jgi:hypothetical protein